MALWCRVRMGDDTWSDGWSESLMYGVLLLLMMFALGFVFGAAEARGDLIVAVESVGARVYAGNDVVVTLPHDLGFLSFNQAETYEAGANVPGSGLAMMSVGPAWSDGVGGSGLVGSGVALGAISIQTVDMLVEGWPRVIWDGFGREIGYSEQAAMDGVLWGGGAGLPAWVAGDGDPDGNEAPVWVPFQWERFEWYSVTGMQQAVRGSGWVSLTSIAQMVPVVDPVTGVQWITGSGYTVETVVLAQLDVGLRSGQLPDGWSGGGAAGGAAVPEPDGIGGMLAAAAVAAGYGAWQRRRIGGDAGGAGVGEQQT